jgi:tubulin polyglutamylase TTLL6/13
MCFEILGFDIFLDNKLKPWILEVNHAPSFVCDTPLDTKIKKGLLTDVVKLLNLSISKKQKFKREKANEFQKRALKGKIRMTVKEREVIKEKKNRKRDKFEKNNQGGFELIYPLVSIDKMSKYDEFQEVAKILINEHQGIVDKKMIKFPEKETAASSASTSGVNTIRP